MFKGKVLLFSLLLVFATAVYAGDVDDCESECWVVDEGCRLSICPAGDFEFIRDMCGTGNSYIRVVVRDAAGAGIPGIPWTDYWMGACTEDATPPDKLCICPGGIVADSLTNANGETTISGRIAGGGCVLEDGVYLAVQGKIILDDLGGADPDCLLETPICLDIIIVSPDLTADCQVVLGDLGVFGQSYNKCEGDAGYNSCCDYNDDTCCNLSDFAFMGEHYQHNCGP
ncbi:MAG: hypothetical protein JSV33_11175 [bacterium]|nr:MAG: hypothetical protein JSV33_11175 [bacterium]